MVVQRLSSKVLRIPIAHWNFPGNITLGNRVACKACKKLQDLTDLSRPYVVRTCPKCGRQINPPAFGGLYRKPTFTAIFVRVENSPSICTLPAW